MSAINIDVKTIENNISNSILHNAMYNIEVKKWMLEPFSFRYPNKILQNF